MALLGLPVGLLFGYCLQRGGFCMNSAFRQIVFERDSRLFRAYALAVLIEAAVLTVLRDPLAIEPAVAPVFWIAALAGGFVFGIGMVLARGCSSGNYYRLGEGLIGAYVVILVFLLGVLVGLCEFPCTGGPYLMVLGLLHDQGTYLNGVGYLLLYNLIFILPLVIILLIASDGALIEKVKAWKKSETGHMRFWGGVAMVIFGLLMFIL
jgi:uncharacterized membrane protein YedE/YeeE